MIFDGTYLLLTLLGAAVGMAFMVLLLTVTDDTQRQRIQGFADGINFIGSKIDEDIKCILDPETKTIHIFGTEKEDMKHNRKK